jgi:hypothetical protein
VTVIPADETRVGQAYRGRARERVRGMSLRPLSRPLSAVPIAALLLATAACGDDSSSTGGPGGLVAEDASLAWTVSVDEEWGPTDAVAVGDVVLVSTGWSIDEGTRVTAYDADGSYLWSSDSFYGGAALGVAGDDTVVVCDDDSADVLSVSDGSVVEEQSGSDERCSVEDVEADRLDRDDDAYTVSGNELTVDGPDGEYTITLEDSDPDLWGVEGGVVTFAEDTHELRFYR